MNKVIFAGKVISYSFKIEDDYTYNLIKDNFPNISENGKKTEMFFTCHPIDINYLYNHINPEINNLISQINILAETKYFNQFPVLHFYI